MYPSTSIAFQPLDRIQDHLKLAVVRGPIGRILSAYSNKIIKDRCLYRPVARAQCMVRRLPLDPTFEEFIARLDDYKKVSRIVDDHTKPLSYFLGEDPTWFDHIFRIKSMDSFQRVVSTHTGTDVALGHMNKAAQKQKTSELDKGLRRTLRARFESDFDIYGPYFSKPPVGRGSAL